MDLMYFYVIFGAISCDTCGLSGVESQAFSIYMYIVCVYHIHVLNSLSFFEMCKLQGELFRSQEVGQEISQNNTVFWKFFHRYTSHRTCFYDMKYPENTSTNKPGKLVGAIAGQVPGCSQHNPRALKLFG